MGQTLTHGVYLPDEGERNCYDGLASNWSILDGAVGTVAEHSTQIAGKAPLVHTHTKSDITDFPVYGNSAGTICEGNDSRLSDARTPVAHTHVTADITDLLNTSHEWSKSQTYLDGNAIIIKNNGVEIGNEPSAYREQRVVFADKNGTGIASIKSENQVSSSNVFVNGLEFVVVDKFKEGVRDPTGTTVANVFRMGLWNDGTKFIYNEGRWRTSHIPFVNNAVDIGSSSNQWRSVYAQNYFYNGVAWGLDKSNTWSANQNLKNTAITDHKAVPSADTAIGWGFWSNDSKYWGGIKHSYFTTGVSEVQITMSNWTTSGSQGFWHLDLGATKDFSNVYFRPSANNTVNLGDSTHKWKTFNGINPGALSIFNPSASYDPIDIPTSWDTSGASWNTLSVSNLGDGWICITYYNCSAGDYILARFGGTNGSNYPSLRFDAVKASDNKYYIYALFPVAKAFSNIYFKMLINSNANLTIHHYIPAYGTV